VSAPWPEQHTCCGAAHATPEQTTEPVLDTEAPLLLPPPPPLLLPPAAPLLLELLPPPLPPCASPAPSPDPASDTVAVTMVSDVPDPHADANAKAHGTAKIPIQSLMANLPSEGDPRATIGESASARHTRLAGGPPLR